MMCEKNFIELNKDEQINTSGGWVVAACAVLTLYIYARDYAYRQGVRDGKASKKK